MKSGGVNSIGAGDLTKVPNGFTDPDKPAANDGKGSIARASHALGVLNPQALQAAIQGAMTELPASETPYLLGAPMEEITFGETEGINGSAAAGAAPAKKSGGMKMTAGEGSAKKEAVMAALKKKGLDLEDLGLDADDIPDDVIKQLAAKEITPQEAYDLIKEANADDAAAKPPVKEEASTTPDQKPVVEETPKDVVAPTKTD